MSDCKIIQFPQEPTRTGENKPRSQDIEELIHCSQPEARARLPYERALELSVLPISLVEVLGVETALIAIESGKGDSVLQKTLRFAMDCEVRLVELSAGFKIREAITCSYLGDQARLGSISVRRELPSKVEQPRLELGKLSGDIAKSLRTVIEFGIVRGVSDIHFTPRGDGLRLSYRLNGELLRHTKRIADERGATEFIRQIKVLSALPIYESALPLDGQFHIDLAGEKHNIRVSTLPTVNGEKAVLRILQTPEVPDLNSLGFHDHTVREFRSLLQNPFGLLVLSGPTGGGKSTTLYTLARLFALHGKNVVSVEDPVECKLSELTQVEIHEQTGLSYSAALRAAMRQDPDVILIGEIRDPETASQALRISLAGHMVLTTVHGGSVYQSLLRLLRLSDDFEALSEVLRLALYQELRSQLCKRCRVIDLRASNSLGFEVSRAVGCSYCGYSGYSGRVVVEERVIPPEGRLILESEYEFLKSLHEARSYLSLEQRVQQLVRTGKLPSSHLSN